MLHTYPEFYAIKQAQKAVQRHQIFIHNEDYDYISYEIERRDKIEYEIKLHNLE